jgi:hypothetical protein
MKKGTYLFGLVVSLSLLSLVEAISGFILWFALPSGGGRGRLDLTYLGVTRHTWTEIHDWIAIALTVILIIHLALHWKWVARMMRNTFAQINTAFHTLKDVSKPSADLQPLVERIRK